jgi:hypothetical protein
MTRQALDQDSSIADCSSEDQPRRRRPGRAAITPRPAPPDHHDAVPVVGALRRAPPLLGARRRSWFLSPEAVRDRTRGLANDQRRRLDDPPVPIGTVALIVSGVANGVRQRRPPAGREEDAFDGDRGWVVTCDLRCATRRSTARPGPMPDRTVTPSRDVEVIRLDRRFMTGPLSGDVGPRRC